MQRVSISLITDRMTNLLYLVMSGNHDNGQAFGLQYQFSQGQGQHYAQQKL